MTETPKVRRSACGGIVLDAIGVFGDDDNFGVAGFEALEFLEGGMEGAAGGVDAGLETGEPGVAGADGMGDGVGPLLVAFAFQVVPKDGLGIVEAAELPFAEDELVEEAAGFGGVRRVAGVVFVAEVVEFLFVFPVEEGGFSEDAGPEVGVDDAGFALGRDGSVGFASVGAGGFDLLLSTHGLSTGNVSGEIVKGMGEGL